MSLARRDITVSLDYYGYWGETPVAYGDGVLWIPGPCRVVGASLAYDPPDCAAIRAAVFGDVADAWRFILYVNGNAPLPLVPFTVLQRDVEGEERDEPATCYPVVWSQIIVQIYRFDSWDLGDSVTLTFVLEPA